ncbi:MAG: hypothetical protein M1826_006608 [Phylliscum demangeonii]|nr:MAG: hypothetical protein M1826_006608 [Phylliscum demangeonii]
MKFVVCLFPVYAFIVGSGSLSIPAGPWEHPSRELAAPNMPSRSADVADKKRSWPAHVVGPRDQRLAMLAKRTTDEESANSPADVSGGTNARDGPVIYTSEQLATYQEQFVAARKASHNLRNRVKRARDAGRTVSQADVDELARLTAITSQRRLAFIRASQNKPLDRRTTVAWQDVASLARDPEIQELAKSSDYYSAEELAACKRRAVDAGTEFRSMKNRLAKVGRERPVTKAEEEALADLRREYNLQRTIWNRVRQNKPVGYRVARAKKTVDDLLQGTDLQEMAQASGYSAQELAEARRRYLDAVNTANAFKRELAEVEKVRPVTAEETTQLQMLRSAMGKLERVYYRMCRGRPAEGGDFRPKKGMAALLREPETHRIAQRSGYRVEEVAVQRRAYLDARSQYRAAQRRIAAVKKAGGTLAPDEADAFLEIERAYHLQKPRWERLSKGEPLDPAIPPLPISGRMGEDVAALRQRPAGSHSGSQEQASQAKKADPSPHPPSPPPPPLQISGPRHLLGPVLASARRWLQGLGGPWPDMPWTRYLARPRRLTGIEPAEWLRAEHAL